MAGVTNPIVKTFPAWPVCTWGAENAGMETEGAEISGGNRRVENAGVE